MVRCVIRDRKEVRVLRSAFGWSLIIDRQAVSRSPDIFVTEEQAPYDTWQFLQSAMLKPVLELWLMETSDFLCASSRLLELSSLWPFDCTLMQFAR